MSSTRQNDQLRQRIAMAAARHMSESGISDFQLAKRKACQQLSLSMGRNLPSNQEIRDALLQYQSLFKSDLQASQLKNLRQAAVEAMRFFAEFSPRLVGDVLAGYAGKHTVVELHLFAEYSEQVNLFLLHHRIPNKQIQKRVSYGNDEYEYVPGFSFLADDVGIEMSVFPAQGLRRAPNSVIDGRPMQRADINGVETLLLGS